MEEVPSAALAVATCEALRVRATVPVQKHAALARAHGLAQAQHALPGQLAAWKQQALARAASPYWPTAADALLELLVPGGRNRPVAVTAAHFPCARLPCAQPQHFPGLPVLRKPVLRKAVLRNWALWTLALKRPLIRRRAAYGPRQYC